VLKIWRLVCGGGVKTFLAHKEVNVCFAKMGVIMKSSYCTMFSSVKPQRHLPFFHRCSGAAGTSVADLLSVSNLLEAPLYGGNFLWRLSRHCCFII